MQFTLLIQITEFFSLYCERISYCDGLFVALSDLPCTLTS